MDCIFCKIVNKEIPAKIVFENEKILAFEDINPQAPVHILVIPKKHVFELDEIISENKNFITDIFDTVYKLAKKFELEDGFRIISNYGKNAGQTVNHLHFHLLGKKNFEPTF